MFKLWILGIFRCYIYQCPTSPVPALYKENLNCKECGHISPALGLGMPAIDLDQIFWLCIRYMTNYKVIQHFNDSFTALVFLFEFMIDK